MSVSLIAPLAPDPGRPLWSVMIPTWEPDVGYLTEAVRSVLDQAPAGQTFQIAIVDDASLGFREDALRGAVGEVTVHRHDRHLGIAGNWNRCLQLARGHRVHLLHQDDLVRDGFYTRVGAGLDACPQAGAVFVQPEYVDPTGRSLRWGVQVGSRPGILEEWVEHVFVALKFACAGIVVRRTVYERLGGFDSRLRYCLDWDMWKRVAVATPIWYEPARLAWCRRHRASATSRLQRSGRNLIEIGWSIKRDRAYLDPAIERLATDRARTYYTDLALRDARELLEGQQPLRAFAQIWAARHVSSTRAVLQHLLGAAHRRWRRRWSRHRGRRYS